MNSVDQGENSVPTVTLPRPLNHPEHMLVITSFKRLIAALAVILPTAALVASPVMAASQTKTKPHHVSIHKASTHRTTHAKKMTTAS